MSFSACFSLCVIVLAAFGSMAPLCRKNRIRPFEAAFAALTVLLLGEYTISPWMEFRLDLAVAALPVCLFLMGTNTGTLGLFALFPPLSVVFIAFLEYLLNGYAAVDLASDALLTAQLFSCAAGMLIRAAELHDAKARAQRPR